MVQRIGDENKKESGDGSIVLIAKTSSPDCDNTMLVRSGWPKTAFNLGDTAMAIGKHWTRYLHASDYMSLGQVEIATAGRHWVRYLMRWQEVVHYSSVPGYL